VLIGFISISLGLLVIIDSAYYLLYYTIIYFLVLVYWAYVAVGVYFLDVSSGGASMDLEISTAYKD